MGAWAWGPAAPVAFAFAFAFLLFCFLLFALLLVARMLPVGPGGLGLQSGFSALSKGPRYVRRDFRKKKIGSADSPPPRCPPGPGFLSAARPRKGCLARAIGPSGGPCHPPARPR
jgi:hypothetical protein